MHALRTALAAATVVLAAGIAVSEQQTFAEILSDVRKSVTQIKKATEQRAKTQDKSSGRPGEALKECVRLRLSLAAACTRSDRRLTKEGGLYFETKPFDALGWTFEDPPDAPATSDPVAVRARRLELIGTRKPAGASAADVTISIDAFVHRAVLTDKPAETYPLAGKDVVCSDAPALLAAHVDAWKRLCSETSSAVPVAAGEWGLARWSASLVGKETGAEKSVRREWYAWKGEPFMYLFSGATFVLTATYSDAAVGDPKAVEQVRSLLKALQPVLK